MTAVTKALLVHLHARNDKANEVERLLVSALGDVEREPGTTAWFALRFGRGHYGIFDAFPDESARAAHLAGPVAAAVMAAGDTLLDEPPSIEPLDVLASKLPDGPAAEVQKGLLLTFAAKGGRAPEVEQFLDRGRSIVDEEPGTVAWFAIRLADGQYGIFDVFPDNGARFAHLTGRVPRELAKHALELLGSFPDMDMLNVLAHTVRSPSVPG